MLSPISCLEKSDSLLDTFSVCSSSLFFFSLRSFFFFETYLYNGVICYSNCFCLVDFLFVLKYSNRFWYLNLGKNEFIIVFF